MPKSSLVCYLLSRNETFLQEVGQSFSTCALRYISHPSDLLCAPKSLCGVPFSRFLSGCGQEMTPEDIGGQEAGQCFPVPFMMWCLVQGAATPFHNHTSCQRGHLLPSSKSHQDPYLPSGLGFITASYCCSLWVPRPLLAVL